MHCGGPYWLPTRRAPFGRRAGQPSEGAPTGTARSPRAGERGMSAFAAAGRRVQDSRPQLEPEHRVLRSFPPSGTHRDGSTKGNEAADRGGGGVRCGLRANGDGPRRVVRLPTADSLCDRMERGEEEAPDRRRVAFPRSHFCRSKGGPLPTSGRRKFPSGNFRSARDLEVAKRVRRGQAYRQTSTVPVCPETAPHASATATPSRYRPHFYFLRGGDASRR